MKIGDAETFNFGEMDEGDEDRPPEKDVLKLTKHEYEKIFCANPFSFEACTPPSKPWFIACMHAHLSKSFWSTSFMLSWFLCQRISLPKLLILPQRLKRQFVSISRIHNSTPSLSMLMSK